MRHDHRQLREIFHFLFLEKLLKTVDPRLFVLKGGVNLRFYFQSPRYSEDMDLDVLGGSVATLRKNGYRILADRSLQRSLESFGIARMDINDPTRAKHSETTQRFRLRLVTSSGIELPTKVEFSRRPSHEAFENALIDPAVAGRYGRLSFTSQHYTAAAAFHQKVLALANRAQVQARDAFDIYVLWRGGQIASGQRAGIPRDELERARTNLLALDYPAFQGQVLAFLEPEFAREFEHAAAWDQLLERVSELLGAAARD